MKQLPDIHFPSASSAVLRLLTTRGHSKAHQGQSGAGAGWEGLVVREGWSGDLIPRPEDRALASGLEVTVSDQREHSPLPALVPPQLLRLPEFFPELV